MQHLRQVGFADGEILDAGLARQSEHGLYDFFRNRLTLPYNDTDGQIVGFMTRKPPTDSNDRNPKYLNSPDIPIFHKKQLPLGLDHRTVEALRAGTDIALVEGPMDALAINTATDRKGLVAVATGGTALSPQHLQTLDNNAPLADRRVLVLMDNDTAGEAAATKAHDTVTAAGIHDVLTTDPLPVKDAAQMLEDHGSQALRYALDLRRPLEDLLVDRIHHVYASHRTPAEMEAIETRLNVLYNSAPVVAAIEHGQRIRQTLRLSQSLRLRILTVVDEVERHRANQIYAAPPPVKGLGLPSRPVLVSAADDLSNSNRCRIAAFPGPREPYPSPSTARGSDLHRLVGRQPELDF